MIRILTGTNIFELQKIKNDLISEFVKQNGDFAVEIFDANESSLNDITASIQSMPFLATSKLVVVSDIASNKEIAENIDKIIEVVPEDFELILYQPKFDKRSSVYKTLKKLDGFKEINQLDEYKLVDWVKEHATSFGYKINSSDAKYLISMVGDNQVKLTNELQKLGSYDKQITKESIDKLSVKSITSSSFDMLDAAFGGNSAKAIQYYSEQRLTGVEPQLIMGAMIWQVRVLLAVKYSKHDMPTTAKLSNFSPYSLRKAQNLSDNITKDQLKHLVASILQLDVDSKSKPIDIDEAIKNKLLEIASLTN